MTIALASLAGVLAFSYPIVFWLALRHLQARDALERDERARDARERDAAAVRHAAQVEQLIVGHNQQVDKLVSEIRDAQNARADEIADLLQRIQAPQMAVMQHQIDQAGQDETYPMTDAETAEEQERQLMIERIEAREREGLLA